MQLRKTFAIAALILSAAPLLASADPRYNVTPIAPAGSWATDINALGQVAGTMLVSDGDHAFLFSGSTLTDIGTLGGGQSMAARMNDLGQVVGTSETAGASWVPFIFSNGAIAPVAGANLVDAQGINKSGAITGTAWIPGAGGDGQYHAYISAAGVFTDLGTVPGRFESRGYDINSAGHVAGSTSQPNGGPPNWPTNPMLYRGGTMSDLGDGGFNGPFSNASAINDRDQVVGRLGVTFSDSAELYPTLAFLFDGGRLRTLGSFGPNLSSWAGDINNLGQVVGGGSLGDSSHGFLFENGSLTDLNALIDPASGWVIEDATAINDLGQIAGRACRDGSCYAVRLDLVSAVPEAPSAAMLMAGCGLLALVRVLRRPARRRRG